MTMASVAVLKWREIGSGNAGACSSKPSLAAGLRRLRCPAKPNDEPENRKAEPLNHVKSSLARRKDGYHARGR